MATDNLDDFFYVESIEDMLEVILPYSIKCLLQVDEIVERVPPVLQVFLHEDHMDLLSWACRGQWE